MNHPLATDQTKTFACAKCQDTARYPAWNNDMEKDGFEAWHCCTNCNAWTRLATEAQRRKAGR